MRTSLSVLVLSCWLVVGCDEPSTSRDASRPDADAATERVPDAGADSAVPCAPSVAPFGCVQGDPETHVCTDTMVLPLCVAGRWECNSGMAPEPEIDCWCHVGPSPWPEHVSLCSCTEEEGWTCDFHCGPELLCEAYAEWCERTIADGEPDAFACRPFDASCAANDCECVGEPACERVENGGVVVTLGG